ncbi:hypothetical protein A3D80_04395 [Candidatus Roizmanbacteria bacterium RIFCSPHIGHO2_02_FULL_40_13b]|uniref:SIS domain-containing protein n=1 Tax=Candidatus Roizmanbacteria bacterium RIFCSPHIGHO2_01_FULL_39_24 TaxID=1802032 RepID=A0A1F7GFE6_9BACT|nr:MAG: hypothetical protein A2799_04405 [Candidatus Roizmanbacteria bacterium RIFCSPHIGHO2_01_FULL_39_24]OGK26407.1 MAG: hypothetical protein A3D80_04395 [Candidatus Roizmanbacteria bacterium RIFCSPHIGHO2_02_FULL_40_13b]OGK49170.1 MAG: hypothetical protein A3A56_02810 [Candidatus Roizmanbacteria bacterium RIFCSPLOWO2_01_FULL_40_32]OGK56801.1 MAG: hypothetical protein A3H83_04095 [Candidatus Roizmanbacteria bacterium RIFCSPLOWO2_02_FULL_39_8]
MDTALQSMQFLPKQIQHALADVKTIEFPQAYKSVQNIVIAGMGGSLFPYYVITSLFPEKLLIPILACNDYTLPSYVNESTLFLASSYSGTTEETLHTANLAHEKGAHISGLTTGGKLADFFSSKNLPFYHITPTYNPSGQPRIAVGYMIFGIVAMLQRLGLLNVFLEEIEQSVNELTKGDSEIVKRAEAFEKDTNNAMYIYVAAEHLSGAAHTMRNQTNETAKTFAEYNLVPELNHHFMEGLAFPKDKNVEFIFLDSLLYSPRVQKRMMLTKQVIEKQGIKVNNISLPAPTKLNEFLHFLQFGSYFTYARAQTNGVDASKVPWVDYFKKELDK